MKKVKKLIAAGASIPTAIKESLDGSLSAIADKYELSLSDLSAAVAGAKKPSDRILSALIEELGGTETEWRELLWLAGKPEPSTAT